MAEAEHASGNASSCWKLVDGVHSALNAHFDHIQRRHSAIVKVNRRFCSVLTETRARFIRYVM